MKNLKIYGAIIAAGCFQSMYAAQGEALAKLYYQLTELNSEYQAALNQAPSAPPLDIPAVPLAPPLDLDHYPVKPDQKTPATAQGTAPSSAPARGALPARPFSADDLQRALADRLKGLKKEPLVRPKDFDDLLKSEYAGDKQLEQKKFVEIVGELVQLLENHRQSIKDAKDKEKTQAHWDYRLSQLDKQLSSCADHEKYKEAIIKIKKLKSYTGLSIKGKSPQELLRGSLPRRRGAVDETEEFSKLDKARGDGWKDKLGKVAKTCPVAKAVTKKDAGSLPAQAPQDDALSAEKNIEARKKFEDAYQKLLASGIFSKVESSINQLFGVRRESRVIFNTRLKNLVPEEVLRSYEKQLLDVQGAYNELNLSSQSELSNLFGDAKEAYLKLVGDYNKILSERPQSENRSLYVAKL